MQENIDFESIFENRALECTKTILHMPLCDHKNTLLRYAAVVSYFRRMLIKELGLIRKGYM